MTKLFKHVTAAPANRFHREGDGRMEILNFAVEYIGMKTPQGHRLQPQENAIITKKVNGRGVRNVRRQEAGIACRADCAESFVIS
jgi:hypothetical protein